MFQDKYKQALAKVQDRVATREELRERINAKQQLDKITILLDALEANATPASQHFDTLNREQVSSIKAVIEFRLKLFNKVVPDIRAVELSGEAGEPLSGPNVNIDPNDMAAIAAIGSYIRDRKRKPMLIEQKPTSPESESASPVTGDWLQ